MSDLSKVVYEEKKRQIRGKKCQHSSFSLLSSRLPNKHHDSEKNIFFATTFAPFPFSLFFALMRQLKPVIMQFMPACHERKGTSQAGMPACLPACLHEKKNRSMHERKVPFDFTFPFFLTTYSCWLSSFLPCLCSSHMFVPVYDVQHTDTRTTCFVQSHTHTDTHTNCWHNEPCHKEVTSRREEERGELFCCHPHVRVCVVPAVSPLSKRQDVMSLGENSSFLFLLSRTE